MNDTAYTATHYDAQDNEINAATYRDIGVGPAVVFDGGAFTDPTKLRDYILELEIMADWLADATASAEDQR